MTKLNVYEEKLKEEFISSGMMTNCPTRSARGIKPGGWVCTKPRSKKNCNYNFDSPCGMRTMNFDSVYNAPATHVNGAKNMMGSEGTNYAAEIA